MHIDLTGGKPLTCSKCGSTNAAHPANDRFVATICLDCGHRKLTAEGERKKFDDEHPGFAKGMRDTIYQRAASERDNTF